MERPDMEYVGFWPRVGASIIDAIVVVAITFPLLTVNYGMVYWTDQTFIRGPADFLIAHLFPAVTTIGLWVWLGQTPGKMAIGARVVDANTGQGISIGGAIIRYLRYFVSLLVVFLGYAWVGIDPRKQGWHDHMARTARPRLVLGTRPRHGGHDADAQHDDAGDADIQRGDTGGDHAPGDSADEQGQTNQEQGERHGATPWCLRSRSRLRRARGRVHR
ncbi:MAG: hypothetical protein DCF27_11615 [Lysobacteraceae bacterium]|nr:MAG: hypothetical protein DCF27_11615 [Xanthomonadaceae bacterium]